MMRHKSVLKAVLVLVMILVAGGAVGPLRSTGPVRLKPDEAIAAALGRAAYQATSDLETDPNDFRVSFMGRDILYHASNPAVAYNSQANEYLVVWEGDDNTGLVVDGEYEIFGQRVDASTGAEIGADFRISDMGPDGDNTYDAAHPAVAYNSTANEYLVVWEGDDDTGSLANDEQEIFGQLLTATGAELLPNDFRISDMGPDGSIIYDAFYPAVAYNSRANEYLVVWYGDDDTGLLVNGEHEIFGQRLSTDGAELGSNDFALSDMGPDGDTDYGAKNPAVVYNRLVNEYLVVWEGDDTDGEFEIYGQRVNVNGAEMAPNDFRLSDTGPDGDPDYDATAPAVAYNSTANEYLVVWVGDDDTDGEFEIYGQRVDVAGAELGSNDFRLSDMGPDGVTDYDTLFPAVAYNSQANEYLVTWYGDDDTDGEFEIYGQRVSTDGAELGSNDIRLSTMGPDGDTTYGATKPAIACNSTKGEYLVVWQGDDDTPPLMEGETEIFGQRVTATGSSTGPDDFRLSDMGGDMLFDAYSPAVAYNSQANEYLVVWYGDDETDSELEIYGQRVSAATGDLVDSALRISNMGPDGSINYQAYNPAVAYNSSTNEYLVVWQGNDDTNNELEIYGQRLSAAGAELTPNDFRLSDMGPGGSTDYEARYPAVAYNSTANEYLVVWEGDDTNDEFEIYGQRVTANGAEVGSSDFRLSDMGPNGNTAYQAYNPTVAYNSIANEYLVAWYGDDDIDNEFEIFGQRVSATGAELGDNDFRLSDMGPDGDPDYDATAPAVAYNSTANEYLVAWYGDDGTDNELEVYGQRVSATGAELGDNDFRLSDMGPGGSTDYAARLPTVAYNSTANEYLVTWYGDDDTGSLADGEQEIFGQRVGADGSELGDNDFRLSDMGPDGDTTYDARRPAIAYSSIGGEYLVAWQGDDDTPPLVENELEIFGQRLTGSQEIYLPLLLRDYNTTFVP